jgi:hypothetical protein
MLTQFLLFEIKSSLRFLDRIARAFMIASIGNLVLSAAVEHDFAAQTSKEFVLATADWAARGKGEAHCC